MALQFPGTRAPQHPGASAPRLRSLHIVGAPFRRLSSVVRGQSSAVSNETIWALKDVSFEIKRGEVVGIPSLRQAQYKRQAQDKHWA